MCGIAGVYHYGNPDRRIDESELRRMTDVLAHRGPDGSGIYLDGALGLGHRRLAIVDLSAAGAQPMKSPDRRYVICYNGETYNHQALRNRLSDSVQFRGTSDTETLLHFLSAHGPGGLDQLIGIFGFAFWDSHTKTLLLARDPLGVKQVYYHDDGERIVFASEIKALFQVADVRRELDPDGFNEYVHFYTPLYERTFFKDIHQIKPGEFLLVRPKGISRHTYWQIEEFETLRESPAEAVESLRGMLSQVVGDQLMADVPVGAFFSGGIDSSAVASFAARTGKRPMLFGVHFSNQGVIDERPYQEEAARALGLDLHLTTVSADRFPEDLADLLYYQDCPVIGPALLPMYHVSRLARENVKVCLGGQGADEIFGGYARYGLAHPFSTAVSVLRGKLVRRRHAAGEANGSAGVGGNLWKQLMDPRNLRRLAGNAKHVFDWQSRYFNTCALIPDAIWTPLLADHSLISREKCFAAFQDHIAQSPARDAATKTLHWDLKTWLPGLFHQDDRMSMANSLESRVPLADPRLVKFAFRCGFDLKLRNGASKWVLRQAVADILPERVLNRRKVGFDTPTKSWMQGQHFGFVRETLTSQAARERGWFDPIGVTSFLEHREHPLWHDVIWRLLCVELWAQTFIDQPIVESIRLPATRELVRTAA